MNNITRSDYFRPIFISILFLIFVTGCQKTVIGASPQPQPAPFPHEAKSGPPAHAPAHGYRAKHHYRYYSNCEVYYDTGRRLWFYLSNSQWTVGVFLPSSIRLDSEYVTLELDTDQPYETQAANFKTSRKGQNKKK